MEEMTLLSKLIKSINAVQHEKTAKMIKVRSPFPSNFHTSEEESRDEQPIRSGKSVHYNEQRILEDAKQNAEQMLEETKIQISSWQQELKEKEEQQHQEAEIRFEKAEKSGKQEGYEAGLIEGRQAYEAEIKKAQEIVAKAKEDSIKHMEDLEPVMLEISLKVAEKIIGSALKDSEEAWMYLVKEAVAEVRSHEEIKIYVHPDWYDTALNHQNELKQIALHTQELYIFPDTAIGMNDCIIETPYGRLEASVDSQLKEIKQALLQKLKEGEKQ